MCPEGQVRNKGGRCVPHLNCTCGNETECAGHPLGHPFRETGGSCDKICTCNNTCEKLCTPVCDIQCGAGFTKVVSPVTHCCRCEPVTTTPTTKMTTPSVPRTTTTTAPTTTCPDQCPDGYLSCGDCDQCYTYENFAIHEILPISKLIF